MGTQSYQESKYQTLLKILVNVKIKFGLRISFHLSRLILSLTSNIIKLEYLVILKRHNLEYIAWWNHSSFGGKFAINGYNFLLISFVCYISQTRCYWSSFRWIYTKGGFKTNTSNTLKEKRLYIYGGQNVNLNNW